MQATISNLTLLACRVRNVLEMYSHSSSDLTFDRFPSGACGATSYLLGRYLKDTYRITAKFVSGLKPDGTTHSWLIVNGIIIDITADQFGQSSVIVAEDSGWHAAWETGDNEPPDAHQIFWPAYLGPAWTVLMSASALLNIPLCKTAVVPDNQPANCPDAMSALPT